MGRGWSIIIGIGCLLGSVYTAKQSLEFRRHGEVVVGTVLSVDSQLTSDEDGFDYSERTLVQYIPKGSSEPLTMRTLWASAWLSSNKPGNSVRVRYLPSAPHEAREDSLLLDWGAPLALAFLGVGGLTGTLRSSQPDTVWWRRSGD